METSDDKHKWEFLIDWLAKEDALEVFKNFDPREKPVVRFMHDIVGTVESVAYWDGNIVATLETNIPPKNYRASVELSERPIKLRKVQFMAGVRDIKGGDVLVEET